MKKILFTSVLLLGAAVASFAQQKDTLAMPFGRTVTAERTTGSVRQVNVQSLEKTVTSDLRNRLTGLVPGLEVTESGGSMFSPATGGLNSYSLGSGAYSFYLKGFTTLNCIVDDVPVPFNQILLDPNQIESITVLSDVLDKAKYGPIASYGALYIKTKTGRYNTPLRINADVESGVSMISSLPEWVDGASYAILNNMARAEAGLSPLYDDATIAQFELKDPNSLSAPNVDYKSLMLRQMYPTARISFDASAGSRNIRFNVAMNAIHTGDIVRAATSDYNKLNLVANVATRIGRYVEASAAFKGLVSYRTKGNVSWYNYRSVPAVAYPLVLSSFDVPDDESYNATGDKTIYGVSKTFTTNYYAKMLEGGTYTTRNRSGIFDVALDVDWGWLLKGLTSRTSLEYSSFLSTTIGKNNDYIAYYCNPSWGIVEELSDHKGNTQTSRNTSSTATGQNLAFYHRFDYGWKGAGHNVDAGITYYMSNSAQTGDANYQKQLYLTGNVAYDYMDRYCVEVAAQYAGSSRFKKGSRFGFFPTVGAKWNLHNEAFMAGTKDVLTKLSLHAQVGEIGNADIFGTQYLYQASYATSNGMTYGPSINGGEWWFGTNTHTSVYTNVQRLANSQLSWARLRQADLGVDAQLLGCIDLGAEYYRWLRDGIAVDVTSVLPYLYGLDGTTVYDNFEARSAQGLNLYAQFHRQFGDFFVGAGASCSFGFGEQYYTKLVDDTYSYDYQKKTGTSTSSIWGYRCIGKYVDEDEIADLPAYGDRSALRIGDLVYEDVNGDGSIDANDRVIIGTSAPDMRYSINLNFGWKNLELNMVATGRAGGNVNLSSSGYFTGGSGMGNYSAFVLNELGGDYPRLSYDNLTNNFLSSDFWLRNASWFKLQNVDLSYRFDFPKSKAVKSLKVDLRGDNLFSIHGLRYVDPEDIDAGVSAYPFMRTITLGAKITF